MKKKKIWLGALFGILCIGLFSAIPDGKAAASGTAPSKAPAETISAGQLSNAWDKVFPEDQRVRHHKVVFHNRYGITLVGDLYEPKNHKAGEKLPAIALAGPYGAVKEQVSGRYAQELAARGFLALAFDPSFTGESAGEPRNTTSPDINTEDFSAAVDFLSNYPDAAENRVGILGICGWGGFALNAAAMDPRIKAVVTSTMYDMSRNIANGYFDNGKSPEELRKTRMENRRQISAQRTRDYREGTYRMAGGVPVEITSDMPQFVKDYHDFYQTKRGYHPRSFGSTTGATLTSLLDFMNMPINTYLEEIEAPVLMIHGEKAHSRYYSEDAFKRLQGKNKELYIVPGAVHTDLYDQMDKIPFDKIDSFFKANL
jgi:fermentation-respiration switch protein FrsA (DUF1100 family)